MDKRKDTLVAPGAGIDVQTSFHTYQFFCDKVVTLAVTPPPSYGDADGIVSRSLSPCPRARTATNTSRAPAAMRASAAKWQVAPVVITSSMRRTRWPSRGPRFGRRASEAMSRFFMSTGCSAESTTCVGKDRGCRQTWLKSHTQRLVPGFATANAPRTFRHLSRGLKLRWGRV